MNVNGTATSYAYHFHDRGEVRRQHMLLTDRTPDNLLQLLSSQNPIIVIHNCSYVATVRSDKHAL
jgi:hypothetical protein